MYLKHFGFQKAPFAINPDPRFLYLSPKHQEALAHLLYGLGEGGGFVMLSGEVGTGKTTLCFTLLEHMGENVDVALILNPRMSGLELLASLCDELHIQYPTQCGSLKLLIDRLNHFLLANHARGRRTVAVIDEAQDLSVEVLEQIRLLTNLETPTTKLLQIILVGQPELRALLARPELRQVDQRITARYHLRPLGATETRNYILHRLAVAGGAANVFSSAALRSVYRFSKGIPRLVNVICDRALLGAFTLDRKNVDRSILQKAAAEICGSYRKTASRHWVPAAAALFVGVACASIFGLWWEFGSPRNVPSGPAFSGRQAPAAGLALARASDQKAESEPKAPPADVPSPREPTASPQSLSFAAWIDDPVHDEPNALAKLVQRWRPDEPFRRVACSQLESSGLRCLRQGADWEALRRQNLPVVMTFRVPGAGERSATLVRVGERSAKFIDREGKLVEFALQDILPRWDGSYLVLWEPPYHYAFVAEGMNNPAVVWLRQRLSVAGYAVEPAGPPELFDTRLAASVSRFQQAVGIQADGVAGPETLARLTGVQSREGIPTLSENFPQ